MKIRYIYKNIKTDEYLAGGPLRTRKTNYHDTKELNEDSCYFETDYNPYLIKQNTADGIYEILPYIQELRKIKLRTLDNFS